MRPRWRPERVRQVGNALDAARIAWFRSSMVDSGQVPMRVSVAGFVMLNVEVDDIH